MPQKANTVILRPEQVMACFDDVSIDLGALCYLRRSKVPRKSGKRSGEYCRLVDLGTFSPTRCKHIRTAINYFSDLLEVGGKRHTTAYSIAWGFATLMDWADDYGYENILDGGDYTREGFQAYVKYWEERFRIHEVEQKYAFGQQRLALSNLEAITGVKNLKRGIRLLKPGSYVNGTQPVTDAEFGQILSLCESLFLGLSKLALENKPYPYKLHMPKYLGWADSFLWIFPGSYWFLPPQLQHIRGTKAFFPDAYDHKNGKIGNIEEIQHFYAYTSKGRYKNGLVAANHAIRMANEVISKANTNPRSKHRLRAAVYAINSFLVLFVAQTGLNMAVVRQLEWDDEIKVGTTHHGFREIKWRADGKEISCQISSRFLPLFKRFLELRAYILNGRPLNFLFISLGSTYLDLANRMGKSILNNHYASLLFVDPNLPKFGGRVLRATAHDWYNRHIDKAITVKVFSHTEETINKSYEAGSPNTHLKEMSSFLEMVHEKTLGCKIINKNRPNTESGIKNPLGTCELPNTPSPIGPTVSVQPDCINPAGCLFCRHHHVIDDDEDIRKLASCAYVIQQAIYLPGAEVHFRPSLNRIDAYMDELSTTHNCKDLVDMVIVDVNENGNLDPYWAQKLFLLDNLEIIL